MSQPRSSTSPFWLSVFVDLPAPDFERTVGFWCDVTGYGLSPTRGSGDEFATLVPPVGDDHLRVQRLGEGEARLHLDLHVADPQRAAREAEGHRAELVADLGYVVMRSPGGLPFCFVAHPAATPTEPATWRDDSGRVWRSMVDQVCLDVPASTYEAECEFWSRVFDADWLPAPPGPFRRFPQVGAVKVLAQGLEEQDGAARAHVDLGCDDRDAEVRRHLALGAEPGGRYDDWTQLRDPAGAPYCITTRRPG